MALDGARDSCRFFLSRLSAQVDDLLLKRYPGDHPGPKQWLSVIKGVIDTAASYLTLSVDPLKAPPEARQLVQDANQLAMLAYEFVAMASGTGLDELPYPVVLPLQRWFSQPRLPNSTIFRAELVANYEIRTIDRTIFDRIRDPSSQLTAALDGIEWPLKRITVPSRALGMLPHFAVVAHEIGHALYHLVNWDFTAHASELTALENRINAQIGTTAPTTELSLFLTEVYFNWLQEIVSDAFAHLMAGPSFFFALGGFLQAAGGGLGIAETHPANELRLDLLHEQLVGTPGASFTEIFQREAGIPLSRDINSELLPPLPPKAALVSQLATNLSPYMGLTSNDKAIVLAELTEYLRAIAPSVYQQAASYLNSSCPEIIYPVTKFESDISEHLESLIQAVPPIESGRLLSDRKPTDFATIINIGWVVLLAKLDAFAVKTTSDNPKSEKAEKLHSLLLKAVELSEARRSWENAA